MIKMVGIVKNNGGILFNEHNFKVVKKIINEGELIPSHNHPEENIIFSVLKGKMEIFLNEKENYILTPGDILKFDGTNYINGKALENSEINITLIKK